MREGVRRILNEVEINSKALMKLADSEEVRIAVEEAVRKLKKPDFEELQFYANTFIDSVRNYINNIN